MSKPVRKYNTTITVSSGTGTLDLTNFRPLTYTGGYLEQILIKAVQNDTEFDVAITDSDDYSVFDKDGCIGKVNDVTRIPVKGVYTVTISNASKDGTFNIKLYLKEEW